MLYELAYNALQRQPSSKMLPKINKITGRYSPGTAADCADYDAEHMLGQTRPHGPAPASCTSARIACLEVTSLWQVLS